MPVLLDASAILAAADTADLNHAAARAWFGAGPSRSWSARRRSARPTTSSSASSGQPAALALVDALTSGAHPGGQATHADLVRATALLRRGSRAPAAPRRRAARGGGERLGVRRVATFDRRPMPAVLVPRGPRGERLVDLEP